MCIAIISWALSGLAHPIITRITPQPAAFTAPNTAIELDHVQNISDLIAQKNINELQHVRLFQWKDKPVYRIESEQGTHYFTADDLQEIIEGDRQYAEYLARYFVADNNNPIINLKTIYKYTEDYLYINRYLPVVRVEFGRNDNMRAYIDTRQGRLATLIDNKKAITATAFNALHTWSWFTSDTWRIRIMLIFLTLGLMTAALGLTLYLKSWRLGTLRSEHSNTRRYHRTIAAIISVPTILFCISGTLHLLLSSKPEKTVTEFSLHIPSHNISLDHLEKLQGQSGGMAIESIQLTQIEQQYYWQIKPLITKNSGALSMAEHDHSHKHSEHKNPETNKPKITEVFYQNAVTGELLENGLEKHTRFLATQFSQQDSSNIHRIETVEKFAGEYGFVNKRLPVQAVSYNTAGNPTFYIETISNTLAARVDNPQRIEGYTFAFLHKWHFLDFLGKNTRDFISALAALMIVIAITLGIYRYWINRNRRNR